MTSEKGGRPEYKPTQSVRRKVAILAGGGMTQRDIAAALGISHPTLVKYFAHELTDGAKEKRATIVAALYRKAAKGSVPAAREYMKHVSAPDGLAPQPAQPDGIKAGRDRAAKTAHEGSEWAAVLPHHTTRQ